jgi:hypothetical protein
MKNVPEPHDGMSSGKEMLESKNVKIQDLTPFLYER